VTFINNEENEWGPSKLALESFRPLQKLWAKRIFRGEGFAAIALYLAAKGRKAYIILSKILLVE
jgi:reverse gyrase